MKKMILTAISIVAATTFTRAQNEEPVLLTVSYDFKHVYDTNNRVNPYRKEMNLYIGQTNSRYADGEAARRQKEAQRAKETQVSRPMRTVVGKPMAVVQSMPSDVYYQIPAEKKMLCETRLGMSNYLYQVELPAIKWKIEKETRQIDKYTCQKATGMLGGRNYTAWFTTELPFHNGPWKLNGLPGLILEAKDDKDEVSFTFKELVKGEPEERIEAQPKRTVLVDEKAYLKAKKIFDEDPSASMAAQLPNYAEPIVSAYRDPSGKMLYGEEAKAAKKNEKKILNNPLELIRR